jgi:hypothetical protein
MRDHPKLLVFPLLINIFTFVILLFFFIPVAIAILMSAGAAAWFGPHGPLGNVALPPWFSGTFRAFSGPVAMAAFAAFYLASMVLATFCNVAFYSEIMRGLNGEEVSIQRGLQVACKRFKAILFWSLLAGLVGLCIRWLEQKFSFVGRLIAGMIGLTWSVASIFAIPILVRDSSTTNPISILKGSARTIKATWGEALVGFVGMKGIDALFVLASIAYWIMGAACAYFISPWLLIAFGLICLASVFVYSYLAGIATIAYLCALYIYASEGVVASHYDAAMMDLAWKMKPTQ